MGRHCGRCGKTYEGAAFCPLDGAPLDAASTSETLSATGIAPSTDPATALPAGNYRLQRRLGEGGMGTVYLAEHLTLGRRVAVKLLRTEVAASAVMADRFEREARAAAAIDHENVVSILDFGKRSDGVLYLVMELLEGRSLSDALDADGPLRPAQAREVIRALCRGLAAAHARGIVHRDLKPHNVFLARGADGREVVKILDFGIAKVVAAPELTAQGEIVGTPLYMSPEQAEGRPLDARSDLYSLGALLYEALTGEAPFVGTSPAAILVKHLTEPPRPLRQARPELDIPASLERLVLWCLEKRREDRPASALELLAACDAPSSGGDTAPAPRASAGERRQISVLATRLSGAEEVDPEVLTEVTGKLADHLEEVARRFGGRVDTISGEASTIVFGHPVAHEDDAARAARAALAIRAAVKTFGERYDVRQGIHTGVSVVGGPASRGAIVGEAPRGASQLEAAAERGEVRVSATTERLLRRAFVCEPLGAAFRLVRERDRSARDDSAGRAAPLIGRTQDLGLLVERWDRVEEGEGQVAILFGEAGIGKSRLTDALAETVRGRGGLELRCQGSPYHQNVALHPIVKMLERHIGLDRAASPEAALSLLEGFLRARRLKLETSIPFIAPLLGVAMQGKYVVPNELPGRQRQRMLEALVSVLLAEAEQHPLLLVAEDAHWFDPTTTELFAMLCERNAGARLLVVMTSRPELRLGWPPRLHRVELTLGRLPRTQSEKLVVESAGMDLPPDLVKQILAKAEGVPLFLEEITRNLVELRAASPTTPTGATLLAAIPATLKDSLTARLDRMGTAKEIAQLASVIGREFDHDLLEAIAPMSAEALRGELARLVDAELVYPRGSADERSYLFKHALIQDAAYQSLVTARRQDHHRRVAAALEERFPKIAEEEPELLAHHTTEAGERARAIGWWRRAGERGVERMALREAIAHLRRGLELLAETPAEAGSREELMLHVNLGFALSATQGYGVPAVGEAYARAHDLAVRAGAADHASRALFGLWLHRLLRAELGEARRIGKELVSTAESSGDVDHLIEAHRASGTTLYHAGELAEAIPELEKVRALYRKEAHEGHAWIYGFDPAVIAQEFLAVVYWYHGDGAKSVERGAAALELARELGHPLSLALALEFDAWQAYHARDLERTEARAAELVALAREQGFPYWLAIGELMHGWAVARRGDLAAGIEELERGRDARHATGAVLTEASFRALEADVYGLAGRTDEALLAVREGLASSAKNGDRYFDAELLIVRARIPGRAPSDAEADLRAAIDVARRQGAHRLELRAALALAKLAGASESAEEAKARITKSLEMLTGYTDEEVREAERFVKA